MGRPEPRRSRRILAVESHQDSAELLGLFLSDYHVQAVHTACAAMYRIRTGERFDLYLMEVRLPDGSGIELCREIRAIDRNTPILFCSADAPSPTRAQALQAGAQVFLAKPLEADQLRHAVQRELDVAIRRSLDAMRLELVAILERAAVHRSTSDALLERALERIARAEALMLRAKDKLLRERAYQSFVAAGGTPAHFEEMWAEALRLAS